MDNVIVTGCGGQTGSYLLEHLASLGKYNVKAVIRHAGQLKNLPTDFQGVGNVEVNVCDLTDPYQIRDLIVRTRPTRFYNLAALSSPLQSIKAPEECFKINSGAVESQLKNLARFSPECRYINAGSSEEVEARNPYGQSKMMARQLINRYAAESGLMGCQPILFNHESPRRGKGFLSSKVCFGAHSARENRKKGLKIEPITLGNIDSKRDWSHAKDVALALYRHREQVCKHSGAVAIASGVQHSVAQFVRTAYETAGFTPHWEETSLVDTSGEVLAFQDPELVRANDFGIDPNTFNLIHTGSSFKGMIRDCVESYLK